METVKQGKLARKWYKGKEYKSEKNKNIDWDGMFVRGNLWQRDYDTLINSIYANTPKASVSTPKSDPISIKAAAAIDSLASKIWKETSVDEEVECVLRRALFDNNGYAKLHWDQSRQVPTIIECTGTVVFDKNANGRLKRARWVAEIVKRPIVDVVNDLVLDSEARAKLKQRMLKMNENEHKMHETVTLAYIWSKKGKQPWKTVEQRQHIIIAEEMKETPLLVADWAWPFLDEDEFPVARLQAKPIADDDYGTTLFGLLQPLFESYNWASSFLFENGKRACSRKVLYDESRIDSSEAKKLTSGRHLEVIKCRKNPNEAIALQDFGAASPAALETLQLAKTLHDEQSGITDVVRGSPLGDRTTAAEATLVSQNSSIAFAGIAKRLDRFLNQSVKMLAQACLYYIPQWSRVTINGVVMIRSYQIIETGDLVPIILPLPDEEPIAPGTEGQVMRPGVDAWVGIESALNYMDYSVQQIKREFGIEVEAGSARAEHIAKDQRDAMALLQTLLPIYQQIGANEQIYELIRRFVNSFQVKNADRLIPPPELLKALPIEEPKSGSQPEHLLGMRNNELGVESGGRSESLGPLSGNGLA